MHGFASNNDTRIVVAMVTYGRRSRLLSQALDRLFTQTAEERIGRVVVCDNGAHKESKELLKRLTARESRLKVVALCKNMGSARGYREAIQAAATSGCEYIWCLDDDNLPRPDALERLLEALEHLDSEAALLSLREDRPQYIKRAQGFSANDAFGPPQSFLGFSILDLPKKFCRRLLSCEGEECRETPLLAEPVKVPFAPYGGFFFRTEWLSSVGLPNLELYLYGDDHEFTARFAKKSYSIYLVPGSRIEDGERSWHRSQTNTSRWQSRLLLLEGGSHMLARQFYMVRNRAFTEYHSLGWGTHILYAVNATSYMLLLFIQATLLRLRGYRFSWLSFKTILRAALDGWRGRLGKGDEIDAF